MNKILFIYYDVDDETCKVLHTPEPKMEKILEYLNGWMDSDNGESLTMAVPFSGEDFYFIHRGEIINAADLENVYV